MSQQLPNFSRRRSNSFRKITDSFLQQPGLPFEQTLSAEQIQQVFEKHDSLFAVVGEDDGVVVPSRFGGQHLAIIVERIGFCVDDGSAALCTVIFSDHSPGRIVTIASSSFGDSGQAW